MGDTIATSLPKTFLALVAYRHRWFLSLGGRKSLSWCSLRSVSSLRGPYFQSLQAHDGTILPLRQLLLAPPIANPLHERINHDLTVLLDHLHRLPQLIRSFPHPRHNPVPPQILFHFNSTHLMNRL